MTEKVREEMREPNQTTIDNASRLLSTTGCNGWRDFVLGVLDMSTR